MKRTVEPWGAKKLDVSISRGKQDVKYQELLKIETEILQVTILSDSYKFQSYAILKIWSPDTRNWNEVVSIHYGQMRTKEGLVYVRGELTNEFKADRDELIRTCLLILNK